MSSDGVMTLDKIVSYLNMKGTKILNSCSDISKLDAEGIKELYK